MTQSFHMQGAADNTLTEYRMHRFQQVEAEIRRLHDTLLQSLETTRLTSLELGIQLKVFRDEKLWEVDGYSSMTHYVTVRWPNLSKARLSQLLSGAEGYAAIIAYNEEGVKNFNSEAPLPPPQNDFAARTVNALPPEDLIPTYQLAVELAGGEAPSAQQITETHQALTGERIGRIDPSPSTKHNYNLTEDGTPNQQTGAETYVKAEEGRSLPAKRPFGYVPPESVCTDYVRKKLILSFVRPGVPATGLKEYKAQGLTIAWYVLEAQGWTPPNQQYKEDLEEFNDSRNPFMGKAQETDEPESFAPDNAQDYDPPNMAIEAMNKLFDDEFAQ